MHSPLTQTVTELKCKYHVVAEALRAGALVCSLLLLHTAALPQTYVDLTREINPISGSPMAIPGGHFGSSVPKIALPVEVTLQDFYPTAVETPGQVTALIIIRNVSKEPITIPVSRDFAALKAGNKGQRMLDFYLTIKPPAPHRSVQPSTGGTLVGSESAPGSLLVLAPQETVTVRVQASLSETSKWHDAGLDTAKVAITAGVMESYLDSNEYTITSSSEMIRSKNEVEVFWHH